MTNSQSRWSLPLIEHPHLDLGTDMARVSVVPVRAGESPWLEVVGDHPHDAPPVEVDGSGGTTHVRIAGMGHGDFGWWSGAWWDASFWDKKRWKKAFRVNVVAHVPLALQGRLASNAARMTVEGLTGCDLTIEADAGTLHVTDVSGRLRLSTQAGRIEAYNISGALDIATSAGAVNADVASLSPGKHTIHTSVGAVRLAIARGFPLRIAARTTMGATRIDFPITEDAAALLDIEADLGAIRVVESSRTYDAGVVVPAGPYRTAAPVSHAVPDVEIEHVLERVADGSITPEAARDLLRALGVT